MCMYAYNIHTYVCLGNSNPSGRSRTYDLRKATRAPRKANEPKQGNGTFQHGKHRWASTQKCTCAHIFFWYYNMYIRTCTYV